MADSKIIDIKGVGPVLFERSKRAKHLNISVRPFTGVRVAVPRGSSFEKAMRFVDAKRGWIRKYLGRMKLVERERRALADNGVDIDTAAAGEQLVGRLKALAAEHGFTYNRVFIRNQRTRWGTCSSKNNISLNVKLVKLPDELIDYVILHELVHTQVKNHGQPFWLEMDRLVGDGKKMQSRLKEYGLGLP